MKGIFCISIDTELLWGRKDLDYSKFIERTKKEREIIRNLLKLFSKYKIPVTWAIVGKMYENGDELWSGKDIIEWIKKEKIHEIGSHTYSHEIMTEISSKKAEEEIKKNRAKTFVFPRNKVKWLNILKKYGFRAFRGKDKSEYELLIPRVPPTANPKYENGLVVIPSSMYFVSARGLRKYIPSGLRFLKCRLGIDSAVRNEEIFHLWFHPVDFADNSKSLFNEFGQILRYAKEKKDKGFLEIKTMLDIAKETLK